MRRALLTWALVSVTAPSCFSAPIDDAADLFTQQQQEKEELKDMRKEMNDINSTIREAQQGMDQLKKQAAHPGTMQEVHLMAKEGAWDIMPGLSVSCLTYNGSVPGPVIRVNENQPVRIVLHNQMKYATSLTFHGMVLPQSVAGLPRRDAGLVSPGQTYAFQFVAPQAGTYWYHPQVVNGDQLEHGLCGAIVSEPVSGNQTFERDLVLVLGRFVVGPHEYYTVNGKCAPAIPPIEVRQGERIRLRIINAAGVVCPLYLTGHRFEVVAVNGADSLEPHVSRDTVAVQPGDRIDLDFTANNPGVWSLASTIPKQINNDDKYPGGIAVIVRYPSAMK